MMLTKEFGAGGVLKESIRVKEVECSNIFLVPWKCGLMWRRSHKRRSATELWMRLGDLIWKSRGLSESCALYLLPWPGCHVNSQDMPVAVGYWNKAMSE